MFETKYRHLTDKELLAQLDVKRQHSPIIEELCQRLESQDKAESVNNKATCPVCDAELFIDIDVSTEFYSVRLFSEVNG